MPVDPLVDNEDGQCCLRWLICWSTRLWWCCTTLLPSRVVFVSARPALYSASNAAAAVIVAGVGRALRVGGAAVACTRLHLLLHIGKRHDVAIVKQQ